MRIDCRKSNFSNLTMRFKHWFDPPFEFMAVEILHEMSGRQAAIDFNLGECTTARALYHFLR